MTQTETNEQLALELERVSEWVKHRIDGYQQDVFDSGNQMKASEAYPLEEVIEHITERVAEIRNGEYISLEPRKRIYSEALNRLKEFHYGINLEIERFEKAIKDGSKIEEDKDCL